MANKQLKTVVQHLRMVAEGQAIPTGSDGDLLRRFTAGHEDDAFAALMHRHGPLVLSVCRRVLRHEQDAEDAFQATFLVLARRAASIRRAESLSSWLYGVAYRTALKARTAAQRHHVMERRLPAPPDPSAEASLRDLQRLLDEEVNRLPDKYRAPFVLCCLEGFSRAEAAQQLGWNEGTLSGRLALARQQLQRRLTRRGISLTAALCAPALGSRSMAALPATLARATLKGLAQLRAGQATSMISVQAVALAEGVFRAMSLTRIRSAALLLLLALGLVGAGAGFHTLQALAGKPPAEERSREVSPAAPQSAEPCADRHGDVLPPGALVRLGTARFRTRGGSPWILYRASPGVAFLPGDRILMTLANGVLEFLDVSTGKEVHRPEHQGWDWAYILSPDGKILAGYVQNGAVHLWDAVTGKDLAQLTAEQGWFESAAFSADGRTLVAVCKVPGTIVIWEVPSGKEIRHFQEPHGALAVGITPDGKTLATADWASSSTIRLRETATGKELGSFEAKGQIHQLLFSPDGKTLAAVEPWDGASIVHLWDVAGNKLRRRLPMEDFLEGAAFSPDGKLLATAHRETFHVWDLATGERLQRFEEKGCYTVDLAFSGDGKTLATSGDNALRLWDVATGHECTAPGDGHQGTVEALAFLADGKTLLTVGADHTLRHWEAATGKAIGRVTKVGGVNGRDCFALGGNFLGLCVNREVLLCDATTGKELRRFGYPDWICRAALTPDGKTLAVYTGGKDRTLRLVDAATGKARLERPYPDFVQHLAISPDGAVLALGLANGTLLLLDGGKGNEIYRLRLSENVASFAFSPDGKTLATGLTDGTLRLWEVATGLERVHLGKRNVEVMAFSPDGRILALGKADGPLRLCLAATGQELRRLPGHGSDITCLAFSPDGRMVATGSRDTTAIVWDIADLLKRNEEPPSKLTAPQLQALWTDLADADAALAYRAIQQLTAAPGQALPFLKAGLRPVAVLEPKQLTPLLADLDSEAFTVREKATVALDNLGEAAEPILRAALERPLSPEASRRVQALLAKWDGPLPGSERLRELRALEVLEQDASPEARELLAALAHGAPGARLTRDAQAALDRHP